MTTLTTTQQLQALFDEFLIQDIKADAGNASAATRARGALQDFTKLAKVRRLEIATARSERAEAKKAAK